MTVDINLKYNWEKDINPHLGSIQDVKGGYTAAKRGVIKLADANKVFVKIATDEKTHKWIQREIKVYKKLNKADYRFAPTLLSYSDDHHAMAIEYLDGADFNNVWDKDKLDAVMIARGTLQQHKDIFLYDSDFAPSDMADADATWSCILESNNLDIINDKLAKLGYDILFTRDQINGYNSLHDGWALDNTALVHEDIRADNFGYNPITKEGKLIDWNWLCIGNDHLDIAALFINMNISGFNPYDFHPDKYDSKIIAYLIGFWLVCILNGDEDSCQREWNLRSAQAKNVEMCLQLLEIFVQ